VGEGNKMQAAIATGVIRRRTKEAKEAFEVENMKKSIRWRFRLACFRAKSAVH
jgi:hypothetical protein